MRYSLRTLMIAALVVPPLLALIWWALALNSSDVPMSAVLVVLVIFVVITAMISGPTSRNVLICAHQSQTSQVKNAKACRIRPHQAVIWNFTSCDLCRNQR